MVWNKTLENDRASAVIIENDKILLIHRLRDGREYWALPGGTVENNESVEQAFDREIAEELRLKVKQKEFLFKVENAGRFEYHYIITEYEGVIEKMYGPEIEHMSSDNQFILTWVPLSELNSINDFIPEEAREQILLMYGS